MDHDDESPIGDAVVSTGRSLGMIAMALTFMYLFSMLGNMIYPAGPGAIAGGVVGFSIGLAVGFVVTKKYKEYLDDATDAGFGKAALVPSFMQQNVFGHPEFTLFVTVEKLQDEGHDRSAVLDQWLNTDFYVRVKCGRNPVKSTCVKSDGKFYETFKFIVEPQDKSLCFELTDQDVFSEDLLGQVALPIDDVYERLSSMKGKYQDSLRLYSEKTRAGCLVVTFRCGKDTPFGCRPGSMQGVLPQQHAGAPQLYSSQQRGQYGTFSYFDSDRQIDPHASLHHTAVLPGHGQGPQGYSQSPYGSYSSQGPPAYGSHGHHASQPYA